MQSTKDDSTTSAVQVNTPAKILNFINQTNTPAHHRANLSELLIAWLKAEENFALTIDRKQAIYHTYWTLSEALKMMEGGKG